MRRMPLLFAIISLSIFALAQRTQPRQSQPDSQKLVPSVPAADRVGGGLLLRNPSVTVRKLNIGAQSSTQMPASTHDYIVVALTPTKLQVTGYQTNFELQLGGGDMQVVQGGWPHKLENHASSPAEVIAIEIARNIDPRHATCGLSAANCNEVRFGKAEGGDYSQSALFETATTKLVRVQLGPGGGLRLHADRRNHLLIAVTDVDAHMDSGRVSLKAGEVTWVDGGFDELINDGTSDAQLLIVELKS
jgi:mannose-6-phosphate isomerase-like protein (cupin superfamily)